jgi:Cu/Ag efflux protein CusF
MKSNPKVRHKHAANAFRLASILLLSAGIVSCQKTNQPQQNPVAAKPAENSAPATPAQAKRYTLVGAIVSVDKKGHQALISNEDIPGYMEAMTMAYRIPDEKTLNALKTGDRIKATLFATDSEAWLEDVVVQPPGPGKGPHK